MERKYGYDTCVPFLFKTAQVRFVQDIFMFVKTNLCACLLTFYKNFSPIWLWQTSICGNFLIEKHKKGGQKHVQRQVLEF